MPAIAVALLGCAAPRESEAVIEARIARVRAIEHVRDLAPEESEVPAGLDATFPPRFDEKSFLAGDRLLYGIDSFAGEVRTRWYLVIETIAPSDGSKRRVELAQNGRNGAPGRTTEIDSRFAVVRVTLHDAAGRTVSTAESELAQTVHELGLFAYARAHGGRRTARMRTLDSRRARLPLFLRDPDWGYAILGELYRTLSANDATLDLMTSLDVWPGFFELPGLLFASLTLHSAMDHARVVPAPIAELTAGEDALEFTVSLWHDRPLLAVNVVLVPPVGPLAMTAGIVTATGYRPLDPERRFVMRLIGMKRPPRDPD